MVHTALNLGAESPVLPSVAGKLGYSPPLSAIAHLKPCNCRAFCFLASYIPHEVSHPELGLQQEGRSSSLRQAGDLAGAKIVHIERLQVNVTHLHDNAVNFNVQQFGPTWRSCRRPCARSRLPTGRRAWSERMPEASDRCCAAVRSALGFKAEIKSSPASGHSATRPFWPFNKPQRLR